MRLAPLSERDRAILDALLAGERQETVAQAHGLSQARISQIRNSPAGVAYLREHARDTRLTLHLWAQAELGRRLEHAGSTPLADLIALYKATMPAEPQIHAHEYRTLAERIADEMGLSGKSRARLVDYARERARADWPRR
jgi:hypothetical protein